MANKLWFLKNKANGELLSPWHDLEIEPANGEENCVTGVIEMPGNTGSKLECSKKDINNPVTQDVVINKNTKAHMLRTFKNPPTFNYGFIPRTWSDNELGGDCDPIDLVDLGWRNIKQTLAVSDYLVLGTLGLVDQGELDIKVLAIEAIEANELGIKTLKDFERL